MTIIIDYTKASLLLNKLTSSLTYLHNNQIKQKILNRINFVFPKAIETLHRREA